MSRNISTSSHLSKKTQMICMILILVVILAAVSTPARAAQSVKKPPNCKIIHIVQKGEWLWWIAKQYGITTTEIIKANNLKNKPGIRPGDWLCIPRVGFDRKYSKAQLSAKVYAVTRIKVWGSYFPYKTRWFVRVRDTRDREWKKIGTVRPDKYGKFTAHFKLPKQLKNARNLEVCLKETSRGYKICTRIRR